MPIPKIIHTIWLNEQGQFPELVTQCIASQKIPGYEHRLVTLDSPEWTQCLEESRYMRECAPTKVWVKASDYLRMWLLWKFGGVFLDADMSVLEGKNFDDMLEPAMFIGWEFRGYYANSGLGAEAGHPMLKKYLDRIERNFRGDGELIFDIGMRIWTDCFWGEDLPRYGIVVHPTEVFYPYNHITGVVNVTPLTRVYHHYASNWAANDWKTLEQIHRQERYGDT
jgi:hypothetical protein